MCLETLRSVIVDFQSVSAPSPLNQHCQVDKAIKRNRHVTLSSWEVADRFHAFRLVGNLSGTILLNNAIKQPHAQSGARQLPNLIYHRVSPVPVD
jgi:hypothetical protein